MARLWALDSLRGFAVALMVLFNWSFALKYFNVFTLGGGWLYWWLFPRLVGALFLFIAGVSLALSWKQDKDSVHYVKRAAFLLSLGLVITGVTWFFFPQEFVFFGVLHLLGASTFLVLPLLSKPRLAGLLGLSWIALAPLINGFEASGLLAASFGFSVPGINSLDYFPLIPWAGVVFLGAACSIGVAKALKDFKELTWAKPLVFLGKNSLAVYLLHQPLLLLALFVLGIRPF